MEEVSTTAFFGDRKVVLFSVPGAFTPTCSAQHLPGFVQNADAIKARGVDEIVCIAVNDAFVMDAWAKSQNPGAAVTLLADGNGEFTQALGLGLDGTGFRAWPARAAVRHGGGERHDRPPGRGGAGRVRGIERREDPGRPLMPLGIVPAAEDRCR